MRPQSRSTDYSRSARRKSEKDANTALTASLEQSILIEQLRAENSKLRKHVQILYKRSIRVPDEMSQCVCGNGDGRPSKSSRTGLVCYNCGGEA